MRTSHKTGTRIWNQDVSIYNYIYIYAATWFAGPRSSTELKRAHSFESWYDCKVHVANVSTMAEVTKPHSL